MFRLDKYGIFEYFLAIVTNYSNDVGAGVEILGKEYTGKRSIDWERQPKPTSTDILFRSISQMKCYLFVCLFVSYCTVMLRLVIACARDDV